MTKKIISVILLVLLLTVSAVSVFATVDPEPFVDRADLLNTEERKELLAKIDEVSSKTGCVIAVYTEESLNGEDVSAVAKSELDDFPSDDGVLLLISEADRDYSIATKGYAKKALGTAARKSIEDAFKSDLSEGNYLSAFKTFAEKCGEIISAAQSGEEFKAPFKWKNRIIISAVISAIVALIATASMKGSLSSVRKKELANDYMVKNSLNIYASNERFLYKDTDTKAKAQNTDSNRSSGTSSGKF